MRIKYKVLIALVIVAVMGLAGFLVWRFKSRVELTSSFQDPFVSLTEEGLEFIGDYEMVRDRGTRPNTGLGKDMDVYLSVLERSTHIVVSDHEHVIEQRGRVLSLEHIIIVDPNQITVFIPNQELISKKDEKYLLEPGGVQHVLCKSLYARTIFERLKKQHDCTWTLDSFIFPPVLTTRFFTQPKDRKVYLHPAGGSWMKHTGRVLEAWLRNSHWPQLVVTCRGHCRVMHEKILRRVGHAPNIRLYDLLSKSEMHTLQKHSGVVILPSACEGFGHSVYEAMENGNLLITADIPPLNENLIDGKNCLLISTTSSEAIGDPNGKFKWSQEYSKYAGQAGSFCFDISVDGIEAAVKRSLALSSADYSRIRLGAVEKVHQLAYDGEESMRSAFKKVGLQVIRKSGELPSCFLSEPVEEGERVVAAKFTRSDACVLEFGGGSGAVSAVLQQVLLNRRDHVVVQPALGVGDEEPMFGGLKYLEANKKACKSQYHIIDHILEAGEGPSILRLVSRPFDTIVADCEGCLPGEYRKNPDLFKYITMIQVERDDTQIEGAENYEPFLVDLGFHKVHSGKGCGVRCATEVWTRGEDHILNRDMLVFDCFMASAGEEDLLLLRIMTTSRYVHMYIIMDSNESHTGRKKPLIDLSVIPPDLRHKIVYESVIFPESMKVEDPSKASDTSVAWEREGYQRDRIMSHLDRMARANDFCYISDLDEIPYYDRILSKLSKNSSLVHYQLPTYVFNIHFREKDYLPHAAMGASYRNLSQSLLGEHASLTSLRFEGLRTHNGGLKRLKHLKSKEIEKGCVVHLNRFSGPLALARKEANMVEAKGRGQEVNVESFRRYFRIICDGQDGSRIEGTHVRKMLVNNPDVPPLTHEYLHPIHTMHPQDLKRIHNHVKGMSDVELESFVKTWFSKR